MDKQLDEEDTNYRSLVKTLTWRLIASLTTMILVFTFTGEWSEAFAVAGFEVVAKLIFYYLHERAWTHIKWGKKFIKLAGE